MSECRQVTDRLAAYVDGLLAPDERESVDRHLGACPPCRQLADDCRGGQAILRRRAAHLLDEPVPQGLRRRCEALASPRASMARLAVLGPWWRVRLVPVLLTVVVMVFMTSALLSIATRRSDAVLAAQLTADHSKCFRLVGPPAGDADAAQIEQLLADRYGWTVHVPPSSPVDGVQLLGARRCLYGDGMVPHLMYRARGDEVSLFVLEETTRAPGDLVELGHRSQIWSRGETTFVLVAENGAPGMAGAARYLMREAR